METKIENVIYIISNFFALLMSIFIGYFNYLALGNKFTFVLVTLFFSILFVPSNLNLFRLRKKKIYNVWYNIILLIVSLYCFVISGIGILLYYSNYFIDHGSKAIKIVVEYSPVMALLIIMSYIFSFLVEKIVVDTKEDYTSLYLFIIGATAAIPFFSSVNKFTLISNILLIIFILKQLIGHKGACSNDTIRITYIIILLLSICSFNVLGIILSSIMFFDLDKIGVNV